MPRPKPIMSAFPSAMSSRSAMAWTMPGGIAVCLISAKCRVDFSEASERLQQPVQIIALGLGPAHLRGAAAQLFQNGAGARQIGRSGDLDSGIAQGRGGAAQRIFGSTVLAALCRVVGQLLR